MGLDNLGLDLVEATIARALARGGDFAEVFVEDRDGLTLRLEDGRLEQVVGGSERGAGVRLLSGEHTYYAYTDVLDEASLAAAADAVAAALRDARPATSVIDLGAVRSDAGRHPVKVPPDRVDVARKAALVHAADDEARAAGAEVAQVVAGYADVRQEVLIANSLGDVVRDARTRTRLSVQVVARRDGIIQTGHETLGASAGFEVMDEAAVLAVARAAAGKAIVMLDARPAPMGTMPVVLANGFGGTLFHEACGHGLEADAVAKGASVYAGKMGEMVAAAIVNAFDDGTVPNGWGSQAFDDEGVPTQRTQLIEDGRLTGYLYDRLRARQLGAAPSGNGRRQTFCHVPIPRMTTTSIAPGDATSEEVIAATSRGFYAKSLAGGQVEPASGAFVFGVAEGYLIEGGHVTSPLRGATLVGNGIDVLKSIDMIADDYEEKSGICGKDGQAIPVGTGQATLRISAMTIGGTG
ncbi:MAG TPA: TldD/PmbA family protein [Thermoleophilia bacterium]|nr:TldD/PmbA family protein [Thermoleophilia bacterium]